MKHIVKVLDLSRLEKDPDYMGHEVEKEIPDTGRHRLLCEVCGASIYPECREWCPNEERHIARGEKEVE